MQTENFSAAKHHLILEKAADGLSRADQVSFAGHLIKTLNNKSYPFGPKRPWLPWIIKKCIKDLSQYLKEPLKQAACLDVLKKAWQTLKNML